MRKREVIELRHRIDCVGWPCASAVINKERSLTARPGKHTGVQEHGTPDIVMFVIPGRPEWLRRKKNCGREYRPSASPLVPCTPQQYRRTMRVTVSISFSFAWFPPYGAAPVWGGSAASAVLHTASRRASVGAFPACSNGWGSLSRRACCPRAGICPAAVWRIPAWRHTPGKALHPFSHAHHDNTGAP